VVGSFTPSGTSYQNFSTPVFNVTAGSHAITFQGLDGPGDTALVDAVVLVNTFPIANGGFEQVSVGAGQYQYRLAGSPWSFSGTAGISANNSSFTASNPAAPEGVQVAFLQNTGSFSQSVSNFAAGSYVLTFNAAQRNTGISRQDFRVLVDGVVVGSFTPSGTSYHNFSTAVFNATAGSHTIMFQGLNSAGGDNTVLVDQIAVTLVNGCPMVDGGFEQVQVGVSNYKYNPSGSPWTFLGSAGITANYSGLSAGSQGAPEGTQVAFLQKTGSFSQSVSNWAAGSYVLTFNAAQRSYGTSRQDFQVLIDGVVVGSFTPSDSAYQSFSTAVFNVTAGSHTITFRGLNSAGGDNTVLIDQVALQSKYPT
jgi:hypothetical protein